MALFVYLCVPYAVMSARRSRSHGLLDGSSLPGQRQQRQARAAEPGGEASTSGSAGPSQPSQVQACPLKDLQNQQEAFHLDPILGVCSEIPSSILSHPKLRQLSGPALLSALKAFLGEVVDLVDTSCLPQGMSLSQPLRLRQPSRGQPSTSWDKSACMEWVLQPNAPKALCPLKGKGYLHLRVNRERSIGVHRLVMLAVWGPPYPLKKEILRGGREKKGVWFTMHLCDNPRCLNPMHLAYGKAFDNSNTRKSQEEIQALKTQAEQRRHSWWAELVKGRAP